VGDRCGGFACEEDAACELSVLFEVCYEDYDGWNGVLACRDCNCVNAHGRSK
jgi:hypothetical protein